MTADDLEDALVAVDRAKATLDVRLARLREHLVQLGAAAAPSVANTAEAVQFARAVAVVAAAEAKAVAADVAAIDAALDVASRICMNRVKALLAREPGTTAPPEWKN